MSEIKTISPYVFPGVRAISCNDVSVVLLKIVSDVTGISQSNILGTKRDHDIVVARSIYCYFARRRFNQTYTTIGNSINRNHASVIHLCKLVDDMLLMKNRRWSTYVEIIEKAISL